MRRPLKPSLYRPASFQTIKFVYGLRNIDPERHTLISRVPELMAMDAPEVLPAGSCIAWMAGPIRVVCEEVIMRGGYVQL
jgi:hypothetical protein